MLTERDRAILEALTVKVRLFSLDQVAGAWWDRTATGAANARRRLARLRQMGLVEPWRVNAHPLLSLDSPVASWSPGDPVPDPWQVAYRLQSRWQEAPKQTAVWVASKRAINQFGGAGRRLMHPLQATHDLHVSGIYLRLLASNRELAEAWVGEDELGHNRGGKLHDAVIQDPEGETRLVIEFGGSYPAERVERVHEHCLREMVPYQLW